MNLKSVIETILFIHGEPITADKLVKVLKRDKNDILNALQELEREKEKGMVILKKDGAYQLGSNPQNTSYIEELIKSEFSEELSKSALETIAIIAYKGPLSRSQIEYVRGINSAFTLRNLLMRGLVERIENPKDARSYLYRISFDFLKHLGVTKVEDLPAYQEFLKEKIEVFEYKNEPSGDKR